MRYGPMDLPLEAEGRVPVLQALAVGLEEVGQPEEQSFQEVPGGDVPGAQKEGLKMRSDVLEVCDA